MREGSHDAGRDGIADEREDDRNGLRRPFCRERGRLVAGENHVHAGLGQGSGGGGHPLGITIGELDLEDDVATFFEPEVPEAGLDPVEGGVIGRPRVVQHTDAVGRTRALGAYRGRQHPDQHEDGGSEDDRREAPGHRYFFTSGQPPWSMGRNASAAGMVARSL